MDVQERPSSDCFSQSLVRTVTYGIDRDICNSVGQGVLNLPYENIRRKRQRIKPKWI